MFSVSLLFSKTGFAQSILISPAPIDESGFGFIKVIGQDEEGYFILLSNLSLNTASDRIGFKTRKYKLAYYTNALVKKWSKNIDAANDSDIDAVTFFNGKALVVSSAFNKPDQTIVYTISTVNNAGMLTGNAGKKVSFTPVNSSYEKARIIFSITRQQFAIVTKEITTDTSQTLYAAVIDTTLGVLTQKTILIPHSEKKFDFDSYALSVNGDLAVMGYHSEKVKALSSKRKIDFFVYASGRYESGFKEYAIPSQKPISSLGIAFDNFNNKVVIAGFYIERDAGSGTGIFYATIDIAKNDELVFNTKIIDNNSSNLKRERSLSSGTGIMDYPIERIVIRNDGGAIVVAEAAYTTEYSYYDSFSQSFTQRLEYHFENVVVISVNPDASVDWSAIVDKNQVSLDDEGVFSSFCALVGSEQFLILYNDYISRRNKITPAIISSKGILSRGKSVPMSEGFIILPRSGKQVSENELLIPAYKKRDLHLVRFTFE